MGRAFAQFLKGIAVAVILLGIFFRFYNIEKKFYWLDEVGTSFLLSGSSWTAFDTEIPEGESFQAEELVAEYQSQRSGRSLSHMMFFVANDTHPPLYYLVAYGGQRLLGSSVLATRLISVLLSLLLLPAVYWLCRELFSRPSVAWATTALASIAPVNVLYAQEARMYALWAVLIVTCSAALLRALRLGRLSMWSLYVLLAILSLYTHLFSLLVLFGHAVYMLFREGITWNRSVRSFVLAGTTVFLAFLPWWIVVFLHKDAFSSNSAWIYNFPTSPSALLLGVGKLITESIADFQLAYLTMYNPGIGKPPFHVGVLLRPLIVALLVYSTFFLWRTGRRAAREGASRPEVFVLTLILVTAGVLVGRDLVSGSIVSLHSRYLIPTFLGLQLALGYLLGTRLDHPSLGRPKLGGALLALLLLLGLASCFASSQSKSWSNKGASDGHLIADVINHREGASVIFRTDPRRVLAVCHELEAGTPVRIMHEADPSEFAPTSFPTFLIGITEEDRARLSAKYHLTHAGDFHGYLGEFWLIESPISAESRHSSLTRPDGTPSTHARR